MDPSTEVTCPECSEQQAYAEECLSCGASLLLLEDDIPTIQGDKTVSIPWPSQAVSKTTSPKPTPGADPVQGTFPEKTPAANTRETRSHSTVTGRSKKPDTPSPSWDWQPTEVGTNEEAVVTRSETSPQEETSHSQDLNIAKPFPTVEQVSTFDTSNSGFPGQHADKESPISVPILEKTSASSDQVRHPLFWGTGQSLFGIFIVNTFLTLITLGIYSFWGRARVRAFLNSQTSFAGARFAYHGTGKELFTGWLKAMLVFGLPYLSLSVLPFLGYGIPQYISQGIAGVLLFCFIPVAVVGAHRYRLSRTSLRNIRFSFRGTVSDYAKLWLKGAVLTVLTLGFYYPFFENTRRHFLVTHSQFGSHAFEYDGTGKGLLAIYGKTAGIFILTLALCIGIMIVLIVNTQLTSSFDLKTLILTSATLPFLAPVSLIWPWFYLQAARQRFFWNHTQFRESRFRSTVTAWKMFELRLGHLFLLVSTLGLAWPWVQVRNLQFFYYYTALSGAINLHQVEQEALDASPTGEELAGFFDTGFDLG